MGILNLDLMNKKPCLLIGVDIRYRRGAMAIYFFLFGVKHKVGDSQFWVVLLSMRDIFSRYVKMKVGDG